MYCYMLLLFYFKQLQANSLKIEITQPRLLKTVNVKGVDSKHDF